MFLIKTKLISLL